MQIDFYHLTAGALDTVLPRIAERVIQSGGRLLIVSGDAAQRAAIDRQLWSYSAHSFLPHALAGGDDDAAQPVLIAETAAPVGGTGNMAIVDGLWRDDALGFDRAFHFFDEDGIEAARAAWRALADREGVERRYWKQDEAGRWSQVA